MTFSACLRHFKTQQEEKEILEGLEWINGVIEDLTAILEEEREIAGGFNENENIGWLVEMIRKVKVLKKHKQNASSNLDSKYRKQV